jgi:deoxyribodipyrimidine photo-lyase
MRSIVWFRGKDLRVADHAPLADALSRGEVIPLFVLDPYFFSPERAQDLPHRMQFLLESLKSLQANLRHLGSDLVLAAGRSIDVVPRLASQWHVDRVVAHRWSEPLGRERDRRIGSALEALQVDFQLFEGETLAPPGSLRTQAGGMFGVFTPFARAFLRQVHVEQPLPAPKALPPLPEHVRSEAELPSLSDLGLTANPLLLSGGEKAGRTRMKSFLDRGLLAYKDHRNRLDLPEGTSRLSADLKFGTLSIRTLWQAASEGFAEGNDEAVRCYLNELLWREFSHHLLWDRPSLLEHPFRPSFEGFPWAEDEALWRAWTEGHTGYPVVDAAARQLKAEGFVHNRARMIAASFLTKDLHLSYRQGEAHYMTWLTDGDWAQNNAGWQWSAGCGCDAQPYFRIFNPVTQGETYDPTGAYVRQWVPELAEADAKWLHKPWLAPASLRSRWHYPAPVVDHGLARATFLAMAKQHLGSS